ncbi:MAG: aminomethyl-transferring glycine dehydrogenase subunit GcvPA, partial [Synergistaceae bacterium]|nr:aminomethyl-transferring glycine dehydrogenase subunit GcvPA [Synergistaceae bacterium]
MRYISHTADDLREIMETIGIDDVGELFESIPRDVRRGSEIAIEPRSEWKLSREFDEMAGMNRPCVTFAGAGSYPHHIPAHIPYLASRSEFLTSYTPYQPEVSQGTLQAIFEFQTMTCGLLGMEVANASMYDGASALAEAALMAIRSRKKPKIAVSRLNHPHYLATLKTYLRPAAFEIVELGAAPDGRTDYRDIPDGISAVIIQSPNFLGVIEDIGAAAHAAHGKDALLTVSFTEAMAWGLLRNPGSMGADIVCGEGQSFGIPQNFGGPGVGMFACRKDLVRTMPGRLAGETVDKNGERSFVLTLSAREQHIRREKAVSNICTNSGHNAL